MTDIPNGRLNRLVQSTPWMTIILRLFGMLALLYLFILSITLMGTAFKEAKDFATSIFGNDTNPLVGLVIGLLTTAIIQSSSTTTSIIVGLVACGFISFQSAIPMVMGANIGTTVTNLIVSMAHISRTNEFKRAFSGSVVHDFFNLCAVAVLLPLECWFKIIERSVVFIEKHVFLGFSGLEFKSPLKEITEPVAEQIYNLTGETAWLAGLLAIILLFIALRYIVVLLKSLVLSKVERFFQYYVFRTPALGFVLGIILTATVQSSSITTSLMVPLLGAGVITLNQVFPYMMGTNVGTTVTAFLASFVTGSTAAVSVAFAHLLFNIYGIAIFWPLKKIPIFLAIKLADLTQKSRLIPILYVVVVFFLLPGLVLYFVR